MFTRKMILCGLRGLCVLLSDLQHGKEDAGDGDAETRDRTGAR